MAYFWKETKPNIYSVINQFPPLMLHFKEYHLYSTPSMEYPGLIKVGEQLTFKLIRALERKGKRGKIIQARNVFGEPRLVKASSDEACKISKKILHNTQNFGKNGSNLSKNLFLSSPLTSGEKLGHQFEQKHFFCLHLKFKR